MPEGHTIHRLAADHLGLFGGQQLAVTSPQGRFAAGAAVVDGQVLERADAHGKHLFLGFADRRWVHVHLGLYGKVAFGRLPAPSSRGAVRMLLTGRTHYAELRGPTACELVTDADKAVIAARLGPDPLRADADPERAWQMISRSRAPVAALLTDQAVVAGVGNVYRAEVLFRHGIDPARAGRSLTRAEWEVIWADLVTLMRQGVDDNRIDTVRPEHTPEAMGRPARQDAHGGEVYVYRRAGQPCLVCGTAVRTEPLRARNLFWCPGCQSR